MSMIKLSTGVELSEDTVVSALKKVGINVEPEHIFKAGDVAETKWSEDTERIIVHTYDGNLIAVDTDGHQRGNDKDNDGRFRDCHYKYIGRLSDMLS